MLFALCSCGNSIDPDPAESSQQVVTNNTLYNIKSKMDASTYENCSVELSNLMNTINTRSSDAISDSAQIYLKPFVNDGKTIQKEILSQLSKDSEEYKYYQSLNDEQLARRGQMNDAKPVGESMCIVIHGCKGSEKLFNNSEFVLLSLGYSLSLCSKIKINSYGNRN